MLRTRLPLVATLISAIFIASFLPANSASVAGTSCTKLNSSKVVSNIKYTCIKSGKKFVWNKGVAIQLPIAKPSPSPTVTMSEIPIPSPTPQPNTSKSVEPSLPTITFDNLFENRRLVSTVAWNRIHQAYLRTNFVEPNITVYTGPNTKPVVSDAYLLLSAVSRVFQDEQTPKSYVIINYSKKDLQWGIDKAIELMGKAEWDKLVSVHGGPMVKCNSDTCNDGDAYVTSNGVAYLATSVATNPNEIQLREAQKAQGEFVEFYHSMQQYFYAINNSYKPQVGRLRASNEPPFWLNIGGEGIASSMFYLEKNDNTYYKGLMSGNLYWAGQVYPDFSYDKIYQYLDISNLNNYWSDFTCCETGKMANMVGTPTLNILIAIKGPSVMLSFHREMSKGRGFEEVFKSEFGLTWQEAQPIMAKVIWDEYQNGY